MAEDSTDVLMTFTGGMKFKAECQAQWDDDDTMKDDFSKDCFFQLEDFSLSGGLESEDYHEEKTGETNTSSSSNQSNRLHGKDGNQTGGSSKNAKRRSRGGKFGSYILREKDDIKYPVELQEISVTRQLDSASPIFLEACLTQQAFKKAVIVKRKVVGGVTETSTVHHLGFLRMEFTEPLITSVDWEDGDVIKEKLKFVCRGLSVSYRPQKNDGTLGDPVPMVWDPKRAITGSGR